MARNKKRGRRSGKRGFKGTNARRKAVARAQRRIRDIRKKPGKPNENQREKIKALKARIAANTGPRASKASKPAPKPSKPARGFSAAPTSWNAGKFSPQATRTGPFAPAPTRNVGVGRGSFVTNKGQALASPQVVKSGNAPNATYNPGKRLTSRDIKQMRAGGMNRMQIQNVVNNFSGPTANNVKKRWPFQGPGPGAKNNQNYGAAATTKYGVPSNSQAPIGIKAPYAHQGKFTKKDVREMRQQNVGLDGKPLSLSEQVKYVKQNNLMHTPGGREIMAASRGRFKDGVYDHGRSFDNNDLKKLVKAGWDKPQIQEYIKTNDIDFKIKKRFGELNNSNMKWAEWRREAGLPTRPENPTVTPTTPNATQPAVTPVTTPGTPTPTNPTPTTPTTPTPAPPTTEETSPGPVVTPPTADTGTAPGTLPTLENFQQQINDAVQQGIADYIAKNPAAPSPTPAPTPVNTEQSAPDFSKITTPQQRFIGGTTPWTDMYEQASQIPGYIPSSSQMVTQPPTQEQAPVSRPIEPASALNVPTVAPTATNYENFSKDLNATADSTTAPVATDWQMSGSPKIQPLNAFTGLPYKLDAESGMPDYSYMPYAPGETIAGQLTTDGTFIDTNTYEPDVAYSDINPTETPYQNQYTFENGQWKLKYPARPNSGIAPLTTRPQQYGTPYPQYA